MLERIPLSYYALSGLLNFITSFALAIFVFSKNPKSRTNQTFSLWTFTVVGWSLSYFLWLSADKSYLAEFYLRTLMLFVIFVPSTFTHFILVLLKVDFGKRVNLINYLISLLLGFTVYTRLFAKDISPFLVFPYWLRVGPVFHFHLIHFLVNIIYSHFLMLRAIKHHSGIFRNQVLYVFIGTGIGYTAGVFNYFTWYRLPIPPFLNPLVSISVASISYAIIKYRLMDIHLARLYATIYICYGVISLALFTPLIFLFKHSIPGLMITGFVMVLVSPHLHRFLVKFLQPAFLRKYSYWNDLKDFWERKEVVFTSGQLGEALKEIPELMGLESFSFFLFNRDRDVFVPEAYTGLDGVFNPDPEQAKVLNTIYPNDPLVEYLKKEKRIIIRDELDPIRDKEVIGQMDKLKVYASVPLFVAGRLTVILNLGHKRSGEMFHEQDIQMIKQMVCLAEIHLFHIAFLENSLYYSTGVAHDIRKPFKDGRIYSYIKDIRQGLQKEEAKQSLNDLELQTRSLHRMSERLVNLSENMEKFLRGGFKGEIINYYGKLLEEVSQPERRMAEEKGLGFGIDLPRRVPAIYVESESVRRILDELLTNAVKYTDKGKITVKVTQENHREVITEIVDTGCGISEENQKDIWELFKRVDKDSKVEGSGIGLACARQLAEANGGRIFLKYSQPGKGSSFCLVLPTPEGAGVKR